MKYQADKVPKYGLMLKYLAMILTPAELKDLVKRYVEVKKKSLAAAHPPKKRSR